MDFRTDAKTLGVSYSAFINFIRKKRDSHKKQKDKTVVSLKTEMVTELENVRFAQKIEEKVDIVKLCFREGFFFFLICRMPPSCVFAGLCY